MAGRFGHSGALVTATEESSEFVELRCIIDDAQLDFDDALRLSGGLLLTSPSDRAFDRAIELLPKLEPWRRSCGHSPVRLLLGSNITRTVLSDVLMPDGPATAAALGRNWDGFLTSAGLRSPILTAEPPLLTGSGSRRGLANCSSAPQPLRFGRNLMGQYRFDSRQSCSRLPLYAALLLAFELGCARRTSEQPVPAAELKPEAATLAASSATNAALPTPLQDVSRGAALYAQYCRLCHAADATGYAADNAPSLVSRTFLESASDAFIAHGIRMGRPNTAMAAYGASRGGPLAEPDIAELVRFLRSKGPAAGTLSDRPVLGDVQQGGKLYEARCQSCHGTPTTRGNAVQLNNPELLASASDAFLRHAIVHGRPPTPMPAFAEQLSSTEIDAVVVYLRSLAPSGPASSPVLAPQVPKNLPLVINPRGARPSFSLRDGRFVGVDQVKKALDAKQRLVILDARSPADWIQAHIPGAVPVPYHDFSELDRVPKDGTWVVAYCACPHHASGEVVDELRKRQYPNTAVLDEGILVWRQRGYPVRGEAVSSTAAPAAPSAAPRARPSSPRR